MFVSVVHKIKLICGEWFSWTQYNSHQKQVTSDISFQVCLQSLKRSSLYAKLQLLVTTFFLLSSSEPGYKSTSLWKTECNAHYYLVHVHRQLISRCVSCIIEVLLAVVDVALTGGRESVAGTTEQPLRIRPESRQTAADRVHPRARVGRQFPFCLIVSGSI